MSTASFLADFAFEAGLPTPQFFLTRDPVTEKSLVENQGLWRGEFCLVLPWGPKSGMEQVNRIDYTSITVHIYTYTHANVYIFIYIYIHMYVIYAYIHASTFLLPTSILYSS